MADSWKVWIKDHPSHVPASPNARMSGSTIPRTVNRAFVAAARPYLNRVISSPGFAGHVFVVCRRERRLSGRDIPVEELENLPTTLGSSNSKRCARRSEWDRPAIGVARGATQVICSTPLMLDATHQEGAAIEIDRASGEKRFISPEEAGPDLLGLRGRGSTAQLTHRNSRPW